MALVHQTAASSNDETLSTVPDQGRYWCIRMMSYGTQCQLYDNSSHFHFSFYLIDREKQKAGHALRNINQIGLHFKMRKQKRQGTINVIQW